MHTIDMLFSDRPYTNSCSTETAIMPMRKVKSERRMRRLIVPR